MTSDPTCASATSGECPPSAFLPEKKIMRCSLLAQIAPQIGTKRATGLYRGAVANLGQPACQMRFVVQRLLLTFP